MANLAHQLNRIDIKGHFWRAYAENSKFKAGLKTEL